MNTLINYFSYTHREIIVIKEFVSKYEEEPQIEIMTRSFLVINSKRYW